MTTGEDESGSASERVGVRPCSEVEAALNKLTGGRGAGSPQFRAGEAASYEWALGRSAGSPVTARVVEGVPDLTVLTAELDAVTVRLEDTGDLPGSMDYICGLHHGLAWLCGYGTAAG
ncbi:hypothetical protein ABZ446_33530 [Streptomyces sp. NPDC005813]|uniref:hypothetical protein n=1 Tax=Streptomyces sp. NPDC005813 TaxID=3155592 RepID=UPI0033C32F8F